MNFIYGGKKYYASGKFGGGTSGDNDFEIKVLLSKSKAELLGLSLTEISNVIKSNNSDTPIGNFSVGSLNYDFRFEGNLISLQDLKNVVIRDSGTSKILLSDIADFKIEYPGDIVMSLGFGDNSGKYYNYISLAFNKDHNSSVFEAANNSKKALEKLLLEPEFEGINFSYSMDMSETIKKDYAILGTTAITTVVLVFLTILFFVGFREGTIASILLPLAFLITFIILNSLGYTMNFLTNFSLVLTLGIAIDTIIVIVEGASEKLKLGYSKKSAIIIAIRDFKAPLISGTLTTLVAFLPLMSLPGVMGKFLSFIPITVFITLSAALFLSLTLSSAIFVIIMKDSKYFIKEDKIERNLDKSDLDLLIEDRKGKEEKSGEKHDLREKFLEKLGNLYSSLMHKIFSSTLAKISFLISPVILLVLTFIFLSPLIGFTVFPPSDQGIIQMTLKGQEGIREENMKKYLNPLNDVLNKFPEIKTFSSNISGNTISTFIDLHDLEIRDKAGQMNSMELEGIISKQLSFLKTEGIEIVVAAAKGGPKGGSAVGIKLTVNDANKFDELKNISNDFEKKLNNIVGTKNVGSNSSDTPGQFVFEFNKEKLSNIGLLPRDLLGEIYFYTNGIKAGSIKQNNQDNEIIISYKEFENFVNPEDIMNLIINTKVGKIRIGDFATFEFKNAVSNISREDTNIIINVTSELNTGVLPNEVQSQLIEFANNYDFPDGFSYIAGGETADNQDLISSVIRALFIALFLIFSILVFQLNSFETASNCTIFNYTSSSMSKYLIISNMKSIFNVICNMIYFINLNCSKGCYYSYR
ncbi:MAG: efflux RND transporter permease subunit [Candidatus Gracilibacteria bacterium]|nr:efflux RND transporter permease subunit [Candidatus Gracilibacteria bacterium]